MRYAMMFFALVGVAGSGFLGSKWLSDFNANKDKIAEIQALQDKMGEEQFKQLTKALGGKAVDMSQLTAMKNAAYAMLAGAVIALITSVLTFVRVMPGIVGGIVLILCAAVPGFFEVKTLVFTGALILAGLFAFFVKKPKPVLVRATGSRLVVDEDRYIDE